jgi:hypothetical protein
MSLDKSIEHGKEHRKSYHGSKAVDYDCRNHGYCPWCRGNRLYSSLKKIEKSKCDLEEYFIPEGEQEKDGDK